MRTTTAHPETAAATYRVFFDGACVLCQRSVRLLRRLDRSGRRFEFVDVNEGGVMARFPEITPEAARGRMHVLARDGRLGAGYDGVVLMAESFAGVRGLVPLLGWGPVRGVGRRVYGWVARNRYWFMGRKACAGTCRV